MASFRAVLRRSDVPEMASVPFAEEGMQRKPARLVVPAGNEASWVVGRRGESTRMDRPE